MKNIIITERKERAYIEKCLKVFVPIFIWEKVADINLLCGMESEKEICLIVAIREQRMKQNIIAWLEAHFQEPVIIDFFQIYNATLPMKMCDRVLGNPNIKEFEGLFLGISHAYTDIIPEVLKVPFANLAMSSQDIYYNYSILKYVIMKYPQKLRDVKYVLIDMYRYNYFNFDVSKSKVATRYFEWSGIWDDGHNFDAEQYQYLADLAIIKRYEGITDKKLDIWESLFKNVHQVEGYKSYGIYPDIYTRTEIANDEIIQKDCSKSIRGHD